MDESIFKLSCRFSVFLNVQIFAFGKKKEYIYVYIFFLYCVISRSKAYRNSNDPKHGKAKCLRIGARNAYLDNFNIFLNVQVSLSKQNLSTAK